MANLKYIGPPHDKSMGNGLTIELSELGNIIYPIENVILMEESTTHNYNEPLYNTGFPRSYPFEMIRSWGKSTELKIKINPAHKFTTNKNTLKVKPIIILRFPDGQEAIVNLDQLMKLKPMLEEGL